MFFYDVQWENYFPNVVLLPYNMSLVITGEVGYKKDLRKKHVEEKHACYKITPMNIEFWTPSVIMELNVLRVGDYNIYKLTSSRW